MEHIRPPHLEQPYHERDHGGNPLTILRQEYGYAGMKAIGIRRYGQIEVFPGELTQDPAERESLGINTETRIIAHGPVVGALSAPTKIFFDPSKTCPLKCSFCLAGVSTMKEQRRKLPSLSTSQADHVVREIIRTGALQAKIGGGEPFSYRNFIPMVDQLARAGVSVSTSTSGFNLLDVPAEYIQALRDSRVKISVSLDGEPSYHDDLRGLPGLHEKALKGIERIIGEGVPTAKVELRTTLINTPQSMDQLDYFDYLAQVTGLRVRIRLAKPTGSAKANDVSVVYPDKKYWQFFTRVREIQGSNPRLNFDEVLNYDGPSHIATALDCGVGSRSAFVDALGNFLPCGFVVDHFQHKGHNLFQDSRSMVELWREGEAFTEVRQYIAREQEYSKCRDCQHVHTCQGGCPSVKLHAGVFLDPRCPTERRVYAEFQVQDEEGIHPINPTVGTGSIMRYRPQDGSHDGSSEDHIIMVGEYDKKGRVIVGTPGGKMDGVGDTTLQTTFEREIAEEIRMYLGDYEIDASSGVAPPFITPDGVELVHPHPMADVVGDGLQPSAFVLTRGRKGHSPGIIGVYGVRAFVRPTPGAETNMVIAVPVSRVKDLLNVSTLTELNDLSEIDFDVGPGELEVNSSEVLFVGIAEAIIKGKIPISGKDQK